VALGLVVPDVSLEDVMVTRESGFSWENGFLFTNCRNVFLQECNFNGLYGTSGYGFKFAGLCLDVRLYSCQVNDCAIAFDGDGETEGLGLFGCLSINTNVGVQKVHSGTTEPLVSVIGCHFNCHAKCVELENASQSQITGNLFYAFAGGPEPGWKGVSMTGTGTRYNVLGNNTFHGLTYAATRTGIFIDNGSYNLLVSNTFVGMDTGIDVGGLSTNNQVSFSTFNAVTTPHAVSGTSNLLVNSAGETFEFSGHSSATMRLTDRSGPADSKYFDILSNDGVLQLLARNDNLTVKQIFARIALGAISIGGDLGGEAFRVNTGNFANRVEVLGRAAGLGPEIFAAGSDTNINLSIKPKGTGAIFTHSVVPLSDNTYNLGGSSNRWSTVFAATSVINTSDAREKQQIAQLTEAERQVAVAIKSLIRTFKFNEAVATKGAEARTHVGVMAQDVEQVFVEHGLDPARYGLFCHDTWLEVDGRPIDVENGSVPANAIERSRLGIRYDELLAFIISAL
jgi:hypothetical protein